MHSGCFREKITISLTQVTALLSSERLILPSMVFKVCILHVSSSNDVLPKSSPEQGVWLVEPDHAMLPWLHGG